MQRKKRLLPIKFFSDPSLILRRKSFLLPAISVEKPLLSILSVMIVIVAVGYYGINKGGLNAP